MLAELIATPGVTETVRLDGLVGIMALHGGLEAHTAEAARAIAVRAPASSYIVEQPDDVRWHVPSIRFDPTESPALRSFLEHVRLAVSLHGFGRPGLEGVVLVGGSNRRLAAAIGSAIERRDAARVVTAIDEIPVRLRGLHPANPVNLPELGGAQLELSVEARAPERLESIVDAVVTVLTNEQRSLCAAPGA